MQLLKRLSPLTTLLPALSTQSACWSWIAQLLLEFVLAHLHATAVQLHVKSRVVEAQAAFVHHPQGLLDSLLGWDGLPTMMVPTSHHRRISEDHGRDGREILNSRSFTPFVLIFLVDPEMTVTGAFWRTCLQPPARPTLFSEPCRGRQSLSQSFNQGRKALGPASSTTRKQNHAHLLYQKNDSLRRSAAPPLLKGLSNRHHFSYALHGRADACIHGGELLQVPTGHLGHHVVQRGFKAGRGTSSDTIPAQI